MNAPVPIALIGDYDPAVRAHAAIPVALHRAADELGCRVEPVWIETENVSEHSAEQLTRFAGFWCVPNSPYRNPDGALSAIRFARESRRSFLGTCGGFQHALIEHFRNVAGLPQAEHAESAPDAAVPVIARLACSLANAHGAIRLAEGSMVAAIYRRREVVEEYHCNFGLNPAYEGALAKGDLKVAGRDESGQVRAVELTGHPFFIATLFQPEQSAFHGVTHPLITAFLGAAVKPSQASTNQPSSK
jgi:CTP synthase (UTP-ammonia lyase)